MNTIRSNLKCRVFAIVLSGLSTAIVLTQEPQAQLPPTSPQGTNQPAALFSEQFARAMAWAGLKEIRLSEIALRQTQDPEIRTFAQMMVIEHTKANNELREIVQRKGINIPAANTLEGTNHPPRIGQIDNQERDARKPGAPPDVSPADRTGNVPRDDARNQRVPDRRLIPMDTVPPTIGNSTNQFDGVVARQSLVKAIRDLETAPPSEFDAFYINTMVQDHEVAIQNVETAAAQLEDADLKQIAINMLSHLSNYYQQASKLAQLKGTMARDTLTPINR